ncbi:MAG: hypothetical protein PVH18_12110 [Chloroflexota bacterium]|jgi:hypothetical protein
MFRGRFLSFLFVLLLVVGLLGLAGSSIYRAGWTEGYFAGKVANGGADSVADGAATGESTAVAPESGPAPAYHYGWGAGGFFETVVKCFLLLLVAGLFFKFIGFLMWRRGGRRGWHRHGRHGRWHHKERWGRPFDGTPPWYDDDADEPMKA